METVKVDNKKRVRLPNAEPGQVFALEESGQVVTLTPVKPVEKDVPVVKPVRRPDGTYFWPAKLTRKQIVAAIRADRDSR
jgi:hypothetical protein